MSNKYMILCFLLFGCWMVSAQHPKSIREFGVLPENDAATNTKNLQKAIDWAAPRGAALFVEPSEKPYPLEGGIILKQNVSLRGVHGPTPRGTKHPSDNFPVGSVFAITDEVNVFITVESATQIRGIQFWYPQQERSDPAKIVRYPPTIQVSQSSGTQGVTLSNLTFYGEYITMDFKATAGNPCELILIEHCYAYPLSGEFIRIDYCYDIPRILHCHVNPAIMRKIGLRFSRAVIDAVVDNKTYAYHINHTDNAQLIDIFTFATWGGVYLGEESYGQLTNFNLDCVAVGIYKRGANTKNRNWMIAQGSIIANAGDTVEEIHPFIIEGEGHTAITNVEAFSGGNGALTNLGKSYDYLLIRGDKKLTVTLAGCRMRNYTSENPLTIENSKAVIQAVACVDKSEQLFNVVIGGKR